MLQQRIAALEDKCKLYQDMITNLTASSQAMYELLVLHEIIDPEEDSLQFKKSHARSMAFLDQMFAALRDQAST